MLEGMLERMWERDEALARHGFRVATFATALAQHLDAAPEMIDRLRIAAIIHDIGKLRLDPRIIANNRVGAGTTRHLNVVRDTVAMDMGSEPDLPQWAELANDTIPVRLGKYFAGEYSSAKEAMDDIAQATDKIVAG